MNNTTVKELLISPFSLRKIEFWAATTIFVFAVLFLSTSNYAPNRHLFEQENIPFNYYEDHFFPSFIQYTLLYLAFLLLNFKVMPRLLQKESIFLNIFWLLFTFSISGLVLGILKTYSMNYLFNRFGSQDETYNYIFQESFHHAFWLLLMFGIYTFIKYATLYLLSNSESIQSNYRMITRDALFAFVMWMVSMFFLLIVDAEGELVMVWGIIAPLAIALYCYSFYALLPKAMAAKKPFLNYVLRAAGLIIVATLPVLLLSMILIQHEETAIGISFGNAFFQLFITVPLTWVLYKRHLKGSEEVHVLKKELGRSNANLDFLRSQINPHFLFNALNTLYGTALQENSERTAQGIQMLGDMMRFMLHENHQPKILVSREIDYMRNYIELQMLRTSTSSNINIQTKIEDVLDDKYIAPMLLIPFVENAFKHGISLKTQSWIRITLHCDKDKLYFDVYNSTHPKQEQDPERNQSGIGLSNVKQRLNLLYPNKHELIIRETAEEYFVHLTLTL